MSTESEKQTESNASTAAEEEALLEDASAFRAGEAEADRASAAEAPTLEDLQSQLSAARAEAESLRDQALRVRAEMENLRRRHAVELEKAHKYALDSFVRELLQVRDSLDLGHDAALAEGADIAKIREGMELTSKLMGDVMERFGVVPVDPIEQPFDPEFHQAMTMQPRSDLPPNTVVAVMQKGYTLNGRLVRPALVMVSQEAS
ncbi:nucleotide exchange factor GrpE [Thiocapsa bogorovii]|uniref:nucleotide exchange factor GrpE n=1 Tax=Thiocapsa bogorovii TaxID=521689 RepID=UPI001E5DAA1E|nr:nucleotide exchange factor GrpE [Thiocapsa bogorovii]UHD16831.1 nucleotide exchange factor GrpE [Thiocapsa bogorovii]